MSTEEPDHPASTDAVTFATDIRPLFRERDRDAMRGAFDLWHFEEVVSNATAIAAKLRDGTMPCDGPWPDDRVELFDRWLAQGTPQ